jgi:Zn-dependent protease
MAIVTAIVFFASVLLHELGHSIVARLHGIPVRNITLYLFGGVSQIDSEPPGATAEFLIAITGPAVSLLLAALFSAIQHLVPTGTPLWGLAKYLAYINLALAIFNLIPGYPLDGGRVFRAAVWAVTGNMRRATRLAANVGRFFAFAFIFIGILEVIRGDIGDGVWLAFIGWLLDVAASAQLHRMTYQDLLAGYTVAQAMSINSAAVGDDLTVEDLVDRHIFGNGRRCFLVERDGNPVGLMTLERIRQVPRERWATARLAAVMLPLEQSIRVNSDTELWSALQQMDRDGVNQLPVTRDGRIVGMLRREDVITFLKSLME